MAHGDAREGKWRGKMRMEWVASSLALYRNTVYPALLPLMSTPRLPAADWTDTPADINGLVRFAGRPNLVSVRVPSHSVSTTSYSSSSGVLRGDESLRIHETWINKNANWNWKVHLKSGENRTDISYGILMVLTIRIIAAQSPIRTDTAAIQIAVPSLLFNILYVPYTRIVQEVKTACA